MFSCNYFYKRVIVFDFGNHPALKVLMTYSRRSDEASKIVTLRIQKDLGQNMERDPNMEVLVLGFGRV